LAILGLRKAKTIKVLEPYYFLISPDELHQIVELLRSHEVFAPSRYLFWELSITSEKEFRLCHFGL